MIFKVSDKLNKLLEDYDIGDLMDCYDIIDGTCTIGYDGDGSTGYDIFKNGVDLGGRANGKPIYMYMDDGVALFFIGNEVDILDRIKEAIYEEEEDQ